MNLFRSIAAVIGTLGVALAAGTLFQSADMSRQASDTPSGPLPESDSASLVGPISDASDRLPLLPIDADPDLSRVDPTDRGDTALERAPAAPASQEPDNAAAGNLIDSMRQIARAVRTMPELPPAPLDAIAGIDTDTVSVLETPTDDPLDDGLTSADINAAVEDCAIWLVVTPEPQAMLDLSLYAPCDGGARVEIHHEGIRISETLSDDGQLMLALPALAQEARVTLDMPDGRSAEDSAELPDIDLSDRLVLGWQGSNALALNAHVGGAAHGESGHVHPAQPHNPAQDARYGYVTVLGDPALNDAALVQVYTFPAGLGADAGEVDLAVEAAITAQSCGEAISARTQLIRAGRATAPRQMTLTMPQCDGFEGFLVIDGLIPDLTLAQN